MKKILLIVLFFSSTSLFASAMDFGLTQGSKPTLEIRNRVLLKVNDKPITVLDLVKRMDVVFYRQYPDLADIEMAKFQFYETNYRAILNTMIDDELILADAKEKKIEVTDGDVRESLEGLFGPDVVLNIHRAGLTFEEAWNLLKDELIVRRMVSMMVRSKAMVEVHPGEVKKVYQEKMKARESAKDWRYRVLTIEAVDQATADRLAKSAYEALTAGALSVEQITSQLKEENVELRVSEEFNREDKALSPAHKAVLSTIAAGGYSIPQPIKSRENGKVAYRIFFLKDKVEKPVISFREAEEKIISNLQQELTNKHRKSYTQRLREHYGVSEDYLSQMIPEDFEPFEIR